MWLHSFCEAHRYVLRTPPSYQTKEEVSIVHPTKLGDNVGVKVDIGNEVTFGETDYVNEDIVDEREGNVNAQDPYVNDEVEITGADEKDNFGEPVDVGTSSSMGTMKSARLCGEQSIIYNSFEESKQDDCSHLEFVESDYAMHDDDLRFKEFVV